MRSATRDILVVWLGLAVVAAAATTATSPSEVAAEVDRLLAIDLGVTESSPVASVDDATFLRRLTLDLIGDTPSPAEVTAFLIDPSEEKRQMATERLLEHEQYGQNWARYWRDVVLSRRIEDRAQLVAQPLVAYLTQEFNQGAGWDRIARTFVTATGDVRENGATAVIVAQDGMTEEVAAEMSRIFLGIQIQCAQCHDHMTDRWKREEFHELAAFFPRVAVRPRRGEGQRTLIVAGDDRTGPGPKKSGKRGVAEHFMPDLEDPAATGKRVTPRFFLTGATVPLGTNDEARRAQLAGWMVESPWFARAFVNRIWSELLGSGLVEPIDDLGPDRAPSTSHTLNYLASEFAASEFDIRWLFRTITATEVYGRVSQPRHPADGMAELVNCTQRLRSDQLYNVLTAALGVSDLGRGNRARRPTPYNAGPRSLFSQSFGFDPSTPPDEVASSIPQALAMMNSPDIGRHINGRSGTTMLGRLLRDVDDDEQVSVELYLRCLAREPSSHELTTCLEHVETAGDRTAAFEDVLWALINSAEFRYRQ